MQQLRRRIGGRVLTPDDHGYEDATSPGASETRPPVVVAPTSAADVAGIAMFAASHPLGVTTRPVPGAILVVPTRLNRVEIDSDAWTARVEPGVTGTQVIRMAGRVGLAPVLDTEPDTGIVTNVVDGGAGWLTRRYGLGIDHVRSVELVTADGAIRSASIDENPDLFWATEAAGSDAVGIVTGIDLDLVPVGSVLAGELRYQAAKLEPVAERYRRWAEESPIHLTAALTLEASPSGSEPPKHADRVSIGLRGCHLGSERDAEIALEYWRRWRAPDLDSWHTGTFGRFAAPATHSGSGRRLSATYWLTELGPDVLAGLVDLVTRPSGPNEPRVETVQIIDLGPETASQVASAGRARSRWCVTLSGTAAGPEEVTALAALFSGAAGSLPLLQPDTKTERRLRRLQRNLQHSGAAS